jgi:hypothetical protein
MHLLFKRTILSIKLQFRRGYNKNTANGIGCLKGVSGVTEKEQQNISGLVASLFAFYNKGYERTL